MNADVVIIGAGVSGLATAVALHRADPTLRVLIFEASDRIGGKLLTGQIAGFTVDLGAEAMLARRPEALEMVESVGLAGQLVHPGTTTAGIALGDRIAALPAKSLMGVPTSVATVSASGALTADGLQRLQASAGGSEVLEHDVSVADAITPRVGAEVVDRLVEPLLAGVYAGRADRLSIAATLPALYTELRHTPDLLAAARAVRDSSPAGTGPVFASLRGGVGSLPARMLAATNAQVQLSCPVRALRRTATGFELIAGPTRSAYLVQSRAVVVATPAAKTSRLLESVAAPAASALAETETASMALVVLAYRLGDLSRPLPPGSGLLVPGSVGTAVKAVTFLTQKWPHLCAADPDLVIVRASIGRVGESAVLHRDDAELITLARHDLAELAGISGPPIDARVQRWGGGLPQYDVGHLELVDRVRSAVDAVPGLAVAGATYAGIGIPACISSGTLAAARILAERGSYRETTSP